MSDASWAPPAVPADDGPLPAAYRALLQHPQPTRDLLVEGGVPVEDVDQVLAELSQAGLLDVDPRGAITVTPPDLALPNRALRLEREAAAVRAAANELAGVYYRARVGADSPSGDRRVVVLPSVDAIIAATSEAVAAGHRSVESMRAVTDRITAMVQLPIEIHQDPLVNAQGTVLRVSAVYDVNLLDQPNAFEALEARAAAGEHQRACTGIPFSVVVVDDTAAIVDISYPGSPGPVGLYVRTAPLVEPCLRLVRRMWDFAAPIARGGDLSGIDPRDQQILSLLASGASDGVVARQVAISPRTVERRVRVLMDRLGAQTRFQAATLAVQRGWL